MMLRCKSSHLQILSRQSFSSSSRKNSLYSHGFGRVQSSSLSSLPMPSWGLSSTPLFSCTKSFSSSTRTTTTHCWMMSRQVLRQQHGQQQRQYHQLQHPHPHHFTSTSRWQRIIIQQKQQRHLQQQASSKRSLYSQQQQQQQQHYQLFKSQTPATLLLALLLYSNFMENPNNNAIVLLDDSSYNNNDTSVLLRIDVDNDAKKNGENWLAWWRQKWHDIVKWLQETWHACWNVVFLGLRGTEIVIRLSPLIILTPASILAESWFHGKNNNVMTTDTAGKTSATSIVGMMTTSKDSTDTANVVANWTWWYFLQQMTALGPCFIKLVQWAASRRDLFPAPACRRMGRLHDQAIQSIHDWSFTHQALVDAFGANYAESLKIDYDHRHHTQVLIGCGSAAQVYKGRLISYNENNRGDNNTALPPTTTTTTVAVKVLHPQLKQRMERDLRFLQILAESLHHYTPTLGSKIGLRDLVQMMNLPRVCQNFGAVLAPQTDLRVEARHLQTFRHNFYKRPRDEQESSVKFPRPIPGWIHSNVLVEEWVQDGVPIAEFLRHADDQNEDNTNNDKVQMRKELAGTLLRAFFKMIFLDNFVHGDLHPGNVLVVETSSRPGSSASGFRRFWTITLDDENEDEDRAAAAADDDKDNGVDKMTAANTDQRSSTTQRGGARGDKKNGKPQQKQARKTHYAIVFLDAGIATSLQPNDLKNLLDLIRAVVLNRGEEAGRLMIERAKYERCSQTPGGVQAFCQGVSTIVAEFHHDALIAPLSGQGGKVFMGLTLANVRVGALLSRVLDLCRIHGVEIDPAMATLVLSVLVLEGLGRSLDPTFNILDFAMPFVLGRGRV